MRILRTTLLGLLGVGLLAIALPASAAVISQSTVDVAATNVDLTAEGSQDWVLIDYVDAPDTFTSYNTKSGGSGITLGTGFGVDVSTGVVFTDPTLRGPTYDYTDGVSPAAETLAGRGVATGTTALAYDGFSKTYSITFDAIAVGVEHTATVYLSLGRTQFSDISADWANTNPTSLTSVLNNRISGSYTLLYTPDALTDDVTVTFTLNPTQTFTGQWRAGFTGATLAVIPEPSSLLLVGLGMVGLIGCVRRRK